MLDHDDELVPSFQDKIRGDNYPDTGGYFFVPLQTESDSQLRVHSSFSSMEEFISVVMTSFAASAPKATHLIFKHHPADRGVSDYSGLFRTLARDLKVADRVHYFHDIHLPTALRNTRGTITINSTVGISSLVHAQPTLVLGRAVYDMEGLTCKGMPLDDFWTEAKKPDASLFKAYRRYVLSTTQVSGSFYAGHSDLVPLLARCTARAAHNTWEPGPAEIRAEVAGSEIRQICAAVMVR